MLEQQADENSTIARGDVGGISRFVVADKCFRRRAIGKAPNGHLVAEPIQFEIERHGGAPIRKSGANVHTSLIMEVELVSTHVD